ncbi:MAG: pseudouridine synthase [Bacteroidia bacterium]
MAIRRNNSESKGRGTRTGNRRDEKPAGSTSYFKKKDGDDRGRSSERGFAPRGERSSSERPSYKGKKEFGDREEKPIRKSYGDRSDRPSDGPPSFRGKKDPDSYRDGAREEKPFRKSYGDRSERSSERPSSFRGKKEFGAREEKPFRKSYGDRSERSSDGPPSFRGKKEFGDSEGKPFKKTYGERSERSSEGPSSFRGKKEFGDSEEKPFKKTYGERNERSSERPSYKGKKEFGDKEEKPFRKSFDDRENRSSSERPTSYKGKKEFDDKDERPVRKSFGDRDEQSSERPSSLKGKRVFGDSEGKPFKKNYSEKKFSKGGSAGEFAERKTYGKKSFGKSKRNQEPKEDDGLIRLNKYISNSGVCSRREADEFITAGLVSVNGEIVTTLGTKVKLTDDIRYNGIRMKSERLVYVLLNKPKDYITTTDDPQQRKTVMELVASACKERIYPVGRLDRNTTGLLLMTNDGELADKMTHPSTNVKKTYMVELNKNLKPADMKKIAEGLQLEDGFMQVDEIAFDEAAKSKKIVGVTIHSGKNRIVRRIFEHLEYMVVKLDRTYYAGLTKRDLPRGRYRHLDEMEINMLKMVKAR